MSDHIAAPEASSSRNTTWQSSFDNPSSAQPLSSSPDPGPSTPPRHRPSLEMVTSRDSETDNALLNQAIDAKRRKSSLIPGVNIHFSNSLHRKKGKRRDSAGAESHHTHDSHGHGLHASPEALAPTRTREEDGDTGPEVPDIRDEGETDEGREMEEELDRLLKEAEHARGPGKREITLLKWDKKEGTKPEPWKGFEEPQDPSREYVWEVLFENQRGLYAFGKAYFSPMALLPADPSPFTLPIHRLPAASSNFVISEAHPEGETSVVPSSENKSSAPIRHKINTAYTPETFQLPSPSWEWLTPWMINMRTGTDEMGWRYNAWFKQKGWRSKAGRAGWWGWVRRREWVRLRSLTPRRKEGEDERQGDQGEPGRKKASSTLGQILADKEDEEALLAVVRELDMVSLDREKLEIWERWLDGMDKETHGRLQAFLDLEPSRKTLYRQFMYRSTSNRLESLLADKGFSIPKTPTPASRPSSPTGYQVET